MKKLLFIISIFILGTSHAEILDRIAAVVNNKIITLSDIQRERQIRLVLGINETKDTGTILRELIDAQVMDEQISQFPGIEITTDQVDTEVSRHPDLQGLPVSDVQDAVLKRLRRAEFLQVRFRQFIRPTDEEVREYYGTVFVPAAEKRGLTPVPPLEQITEQVRNNVVEEKVSHEVNNWLEAIRRRSDIEVFD